MPFVSKKRSEPSRDKKPDTRQSVLSPAPIEKPKGLSFTPANIANIIGKHEEDIQALKTMVSDASEVPIDSELEAKLFQLDDIISTQRLLVDKINNLEKFITVQDALEKNITELKKRADVQRDLEKKVVALEAMVSSEGGLDNKVIALEKYIKTIDATSSENV